MQEQLSKNRVILEEESSGNVSASITSSTHERKSKCYLFAKHGRVYMKSNTLGEDIPIAIIFKAMGVESDLEMVQLVGSEHDLVDRLALSMEESCKAGILTQLQALLYVGNKIRGRSMSAPAGQSGSGWYRKPQPPEDEAREVLANVVLVSSLISFPPHPYVLYCFCTLVDASVNIAKSNSTYSLIPTLRTPFYFLPLSMYVLLQYIYRAMCLSITLISVPNAFISVI
jgi:DNA-directed RNA polymerase III subunit RPC2